jgi:hypothetical protein
MTTAAHPPRSPRSSPPSPTPNDSPSPDFWPDTAARQEAYALDLRQFTTWCRACSLALFAVRRADIESFAWELEARGRARATVTRRLCTIAWFYKYAVEEELIDHSPAAHIRRPRVDYESHAVALDRPGNRRAHRRAGVPGRGRPTAGPARRRSSPHRRTTAHFASSPTVTKVSQTRAPSTWPENPRRRLLLLKQRRGIGIYDDVTHGRSGQRGVPARPQIGQERRQFRIRLPDVGRQLPGISHRLSMLRPSEILDRRQLTDHRLGFLTRLAHDHHRTRPPQPGLSPSVASIRNQARARAAVTYCRFGQR